MKRKKMKTRSVPTQLFCGTEVSSQLISSSRRMRGRRARGWSRRTKPLLSLCTELCYVLSPLLLLLNEDNKTDYRDSVKAWMVDAGSRTSRVICDVLLALAIAMQILYYRIIV